MNRFTPISGSNPTDERIKQLPSAPPMKKKLTTKRTILATLFMETLPFQSECQTKLPNLFANPGRICKKRNRSKTTGFRFIC